MTSTLLAVRVPPEMVAQLRRCPGLSDALKVVSVGQDPGDDVRDWIDNTRADQYARNYALYAALARSCNVTHAIVAQPLQAYSEAAALALREHGARVFWLERFYDRAILDEVGCQYTADNEIQRYAGRMPRLTFNPVELYRRGPGRTRYQDEQPLYQDRERVWEKHGQPHERVVIFGQVPDDMALRDSSGGMTYERWIDALVEENRGDVVFLFKHHPLKVTPLFSYSNVREVSEHAHALLDAYPVCAAYSSTMILEGVARGVTFATGGHHFLSGLTYRITDPTGARAVRRVARDRSAAASAEPLRRRLEFIEHAYTLHLDDPMTLHRLTWPADELERYYRERIQAARHKAAA